MKQQDGKQLKKNFKYHIRHQFISIHTHGQSYYCLMDTLDNDFADLNIRTKLTLTDMSNLTEFC